jgi:hypothetical protein
MTEATNSVHLAKLRASMVMATRTLALQRAMWATKRKLRAQGLKVSHFPRRELVTLAEVYLAQHREALLSEASQIVERWRVEGFFGKRAKLNTDAQGGKRGTTRVSDVQMSRHNKRQSPTRSPRRPLQEAIAAG